MEKAKILKHFSRYGKAESAITVFAVACCLVSFGLFFTGGVGNPGGDSLPSFKSRSTSERTVCISTRRRFSPIFCPLYAGR